MGLVKLFFDLSDGLLETVKDVAPIVLLISFFQIVILKKNIPNLPKVFLGVLFVILGLTLFLVGLEKALFPIGKLMATQLSSPEILGIEEGQIPKWTDYYWIYLFSLLIGFSTTIAEPALIAVALKASEITGGAVSKKGIRLVVALGVGLSLAVGSFRIVTGAPLYMFILGGYIIVVIQTIFAPKYIIALAYDSGGVTTSTVTVPIITALGLGLSTVIPGRNPALDGFGLIALASVFAVITVLAYAQIIELFRKKNNN